ncbi:Fur-regulated basic protein FbpA [Cytobacillus sp. Hz8]|uniref:Fur-regulated basic protein FbpA n=1 Tax=Cytobacillus sp. Hz8 TaxID=3347168 RepID=UPI0035E38527
MSNYPCKNLEKRRKELINILTTFEFYKNGDKSLYELPLPDLEHEYESFQANLHPHIGVGSIHWV